MNILFLLLASVASLTLLGAEVETANQVETKAIVADSLEFVLPVDVSSNTKCYLIASVPKSFRSLQPLSAFDFMIEYIPEADGDNDWSEIITLNKFIGKKIYAIPFTDGLKMQLMAETRNSKVLEDGSSRDDDIQKAKLTMRYTAKGKQEVIGVRYFSGPFDTAGVQYTIRLDDKMNEEDAVKKIKEFFASNVQLIKG